MLEVVGLEIGMVLMVRAVPEAVETVVIGLMTLHLVEQPEPVVVAVGYARDGGTMQALVVLVL